MEVEVEAEAEGTLPGGEEGPGDAALGTESSLENTECDLEKTEGDLEKIESGLEKIEASLEKTKPNTETTESDLETRLEKNEVDTRGEGGAATGGTSACHRAQDEEKGKPRSEGAERDRGGRGAGAPRSTRAARKTWQSGVMEEDLERNGALAGGRRVDYCLQVTGEMTSGGGVGVHICCLPE